MKSEKRCCRGRSRRPGAALGRECTKEIGLFRFARKARSYGSRTIARTYPVGARLAGECGSDEPFPIRALGALLRGILYPAVGRRIEKVVPTPVSDVTSICPPSARTYSRAW